MKQNVPYDLMRRDFEAGLSLNQIAKKYNNIITVMTLSRFARREGWYPDSASKSAPIKRAKPVKPSNYTVADVIPDKDSVVFYPMPPSSAIQLSLLSDPERREALSSDLSELNVGYLKLHKVLLKRVTDELEQGYPLEKIAATLKLVGMSIPDIAKQAGLTFDQQRELQTINVTEDQEEKVQFYIPENNRNNKKEEL